jgi:hypothetical protein
MFPSNITLPFFLLNLLMMNANYIAGCGLFAASKQSKDTWTLDFHFGRRTVNAGHWTNHRAQKICVYLRNLRILPTKNLKLKIVPRSAMFREFPFNHSACSLLAAMVATGATGEQWPVRLAPPRACFRGILPVFRDI